MKKIIGLMFLFTLVIFPVNASEQSILDWEDSDTFCDTQLEVDFDSCIALIEEYQLLTEDRISKNNAKNSKKIKRAVDDISNTLREQIIIPDGVRIPNNKQQQIQ